MSYVNAVWGFLSLGRPVAISAELLPPFAEALDIDRALPEVFSTRQN